MGTLSFIVPSRDVHSLFLGFQYQQQASATRKSFWFPLLVVDIENLDCFSKDVSPKLQKGKVHEQGTPQTESKSEL